MCGKGEAKGGKEELSTCIFPSSIKAAVKQWEFACSSLQFRLRVTLGMGNLLPPSRACGMFKLWQHKASSYSLKEMTPKCFLCNLPSRGRLILHQGISSMQQRNEQRWNICNGFAAFYWDHTGDGNWGCSSVFGAVITHTFKGLWKFKRFFLVFFFTSDNNHRMWPYLE